MFMLNFLESRGFQTRNKLLIYSSFNFQSFRIVKLYQSPRRVKNNLGRTIVPGQNDLFTLLIAPFKAQDIIDRRAAEAIDRLVIIRHYRNVGLFPGEQLE